MTGKEYIERLIEDVKTIIVVKNNTKTLTQVKAQTVVNTKLPAHLFRQINPEENLCEFAIAMSIDITIAYDLTTIAKLINNFISVFTNVDEKITNFDLFLKELKTHKEQLFEFLTEMEDRIYVNSNTMEQGKFPEIVFKRIFDNAHFEISVSDRNYQNLLQMRRNNHLMSVTE